MEKLESTKRVKETSNQNDLKNKHIQCYNCEKWDHYNDYHWYET